MKKLLLLLIILPFLALGQSPDQNYVKTTVYKSENASNPQTNITYFDGLGRPIQEIAHQQSNGGKDIVTHIEYDAFGRQVKDFLPYASSTSSLDYVDINTVNTELFGFYSSYNGCASNPYSEKEFESSPLNRVFKQAAPGDSWKMGSGHEVKLDYQTNELGEVRLFKATTSWSAGNGCYVPTFVDSNVYYVEHQLYKTITKNENWTSGKNNTTEEFKDKEGRVVLKRTFANLIEGDVFIESEAKHDTYYVYDEYGNLTYVLPPLVDVNNMSADDIKDVCYQYKYDHRNRLVEKKLPGKQWEYIVYNNQDMPVATGPAKSPWGEDVWGWMVTKYDVFGRVAYTGWIEGLNAQIGEGRVIFQNNLNISWYEQFKEEPTTIDGVSVNYTNNFYPQNIKLLTVNYYDTYNHTFQPTVPSQIETIDVTVDLKSLPTTNWARVLTTPVATNAEITHSFYDKKGRVIGTEKFNYLGGFTKTHSKLDFLGKPLYTVTYHKRASSDNVITIKDSYEYTPQERLLSHIQKINNNAEELIAKNEYDELGQLIGKQVGGDDVANLVGLQKVDYKYNIRGWLTNINNVDDLQHETDPLDLFAFKINYDEVKDEVGYEGTELFNGNISETYWRTSSDNVLRKYGYQYDELNRLKNSIYQKPNASIPVTHMYDEFMSYDKNGNITYLGRNGDLDYDYSSTSAFQIDDLKYIYDPQKKNQLMKVTDQVPFTVGFKDGTNTGDDYSYDVNGNMTRDNNKGIDNILYNHLNLPVEIIFGTGNKIEYLYNAVGQKVRKTVTKDAVATVTDYLDGFQYTDAKLNFFPHAEGYVKVTLCEECEQQYQVRFNYVYNYLDHLGNIRLSYGIDPKDKILKIMEENHYYPFGLKHTNYNVDKLILVKDEEEAKYSKLKQLPSGQQIEYKYKFQSQERQDELGLNWDSFKWRNYDYAIGRFMSIDPLSEQYNYQSHYNFAENRVIDGRELEGLEWASIKNNDGTSTRQLTVQMHNTSSLSDKQVAKVTETMKSDFAKSFSGEGSTAQLVVNNVTEAKGDYVVSLVDAKSNTLYDKSTGEVTGTTYTGGKTGELGQTQKNSFEVTATVDGSKRSNSDMSRSFSHEAGHTAGLEHPWSPTNTVSDIKQGTTGVKDSTVRSNLMNSDQNTNVGNRSTSGTNLTSGQLKSIDQTIKTQEVKTP